MLIPSAPRADRIPAWIGHAHRSGLQAEIVGLLAELIDLRRDSLTYPAAHYALRAVIRFAHGLQCDGFLPRRLCEFERDWPASGIGLWDLAVWHLCHIDAGNCVHAGQLILAALSGGEELHPRRERPDESDFGEVLNVGVRTITPFASYAFFARSREAFGWDCPSAAAGLRWYSGPHGPAQIASIAAEIWAGEYWNEVGVLADALEEAHTGNCQLAAHFRSDTVHTRNCWALRLIRSHPYGTLTRALSAPESV